MMAILDFRPGADVVDPRLPLGFAFVAGLVDFGDSSFPSDLSFNIFLALVVDSPRLVYTFLLDVAREPSFSAASVCLDSSDNDFGVDIGFLDGVGGMPVFESRLESNSTPLSTVWLDLHN